MWHNIIEYEINLNFEKLNYINQVLRLTILTKKKQPKKNMHASICKHIVENNNV